MIVAETISVGTELLLGETLDSNAYLLSGLLPRFGIAQFYRQTVGDNLERLVSSLLLALSRSDIVFTIGGLGPTQDDLTRAGVARALGVKFERDELLEQELKNLFERRKLRWNEAQVNQAMRPMGSIVMENVNGTAPGLICESRGKRIICLPGPKNEFSDMVRGPLSEFLAAQSSGEILATRVLKICGLGESRVEEALGSIINGENPSVATYAKTGEVHLRIAARARDQAEAETLIQPIVNLVKDLLGDAVFSIDGEDLEAVIVSNLKSRNLTVSVAESATGGKLCRAFSKTPGSSAAFKGGLVVYTTEAKRELLNLTNESLAFGNVSPEVTKAMAIRVREMLGTTYGVAITGNAGPTADSGGRPVGAFYIATARHDGVNEKELLLRGTRNTLLDRANHEVLTLFYQELCSLTLTS